MGITVRVPQEGAMETIWRVMAVAVLTVLAWMGTPQLSLAEDVPAFRVDPFWPKPLKNRWSMQQVTGISVDSMDHIWFINRNQAAEGDEIGAPASRDIHGVNGRTSPASGDVTGPTRTATPSSLLTAVAPL